MRFIIAGLLSAALISLAPKHLPPASFDNSTTKQTMQTVTTAANETNSNSPEFEGIKPQEQPVPQPPKVVEPEPPQRQAKPVVQPVTPSGCEQYRDLIDNYSWNVDVAIAVCNAESSGNRFNENWSDYHSFANCRGSFGLFQINCSHGQVFDAAENIRIAAAMYNAAKAAKWANYNGWHPWSATTCKYKVKCY